MIRSAFTLIELLVVITIIVVLLALLTPALDRAIYEAEMAVCATRTKVIATGVQIYTLDYNRRYPDRPHAYGNPGGKPNNVYIGSAFEEPGGPGDDRAKLRPYMGISKALNCPLTPEEIPFDSADHASQIEVSYHLWFSWQYAPGIGGGAGMFKLGDRFSFTSTNGDGVSTTYRFNYLASDVDGMDVGNRVFFASHPDDDGVLTGSSLDDGSDVPLGAETGANQYSFSRWDVQDGLRGKFDVNFSLTDGSVKRFDDIAWDEGDPNDPGQMIRAPMWPSGYPFGDYDIHLGL